MDDDSACKIPYGGVHGLNRWYDCVSGWMVQGRAIFIGTWKFSTNIVLGVRRDVSE